MITFFDSSLRCKFIKTIWFSCFLLLFASAYQTHVSAQSLPKPKEGYSYYCIGDVNDDALSTIASFKVFQLPEGSVSPWVANSKICHTDKLDIAFIKKWLKPRGLEYQFSPPSRHHLSPRQTGWFIQESYGKLKFSQLPNITHSSILFELDNLGIGFDPKIVAGGYSFISGGRQVERQSPFALDIWTSRYSNKLGFKLKNSAKFGENQFYHEGRSYVKSNGLNWIRGSSEKEKVFKNTPVTSYLVNLDGVMVDFVSNANPDTTSTLKRLIALAFTEHYGEVAVLCDKGAEECTVIFSHKNWRYLIVNFPIKSIADWQIILKKISEKLDQKQVLNFDLYGCSGELCDSIYDASLHRLSR